MAKINSGRPDDGPPPSLLLVDSADKAHMIPLETIQDIRFDERGLISVVVVDENTGQVRMVAYANLEAVTRTVQGGEAWFFSRSRSSLWKKGESSGNVIRVRTVYVDCDGDALVYVGAPNGPSCHTGARSCFFRELAPDLSIADATPSAATLLMRLEQLLIARRSSTEEKSYTKSLYDGGAAKIGEKIREEAEELARAVDTESDERVIAEAADLIYHAMVGLTFRDLELAEVVRALGERLGTSGHAEKAARNA